MIKSSARLRGIPFKLTLEQYSEIVSLPCAYANGDIDNLKISVDRKDNYVGYVYENCLPCCMKHNTIKSDVFTYEQMIDLVNRYDVKCSNLNVGAKRRYKDGD